ncbi:hypothetical protein [Streptomyces sp. TRM49041]|uniref:hypothetical protein n=1 Tax=Streptomyces sp. TRM49041 TaxID=2603216 RepID=UPI0011ED7855|nr:hypothetical protein [Streptomyces sp. TRM49041]
MRGDETQPTAADGEVARARRGPRHAAPRKSLLTKLQAPAGKALALAAMPTAVLVGIGLTPRPALADEKDIPFAPGPCVTQPDEPAESQEPAPTKSASASPSASPSGTPSSKPSPSASGSEKPTATPTATPSASDTTKPTTDPQTGTTPTPEPTPTESRNPLDPLGVGDAIKDFFGGLTGRQPTPTETPSAATAQSEPTEAPAPAPTATADSKPPTTAPEPAAEPSTKPVGDLLDKTKDAIKDAADKVGAEVEELPEDVKGLDPKQDEDVPDGAKPRFPCPTPDPQALADAEVEPGIPHVADQPWKLESSLLTLRGLKYHGIVEVKTGSGRTKKALKFTASEVDIKDLHQVTVHSEGRTGHVASRPGSTSTMRNGTVTMYTEELKGNLFGIIPITFSPETPPPLDVPFAFFTNAKVIQAGQFGGTLTVPGLRNFIKG